MLTNFKTLLVLSKSSESPEFLMPEIAVVMEELSYEPNVQLLRSYILKWDDIKERIPLIGMI